jgi:hypothetical protein
MNTHQRLQAKLELKQLNQATKSLRTTMNQPVTANQKPVFYTSKAAHERINELEAQVAEARKNGSTAAAKPAPATAGANPPATLPNSTQSLAAAILDEQEARTKAGKVKTRAEFNAMPHAERGEFFKNGGKLVD